MAVIACHNLISAINSLVIKDSSSVIIKEVLMEHYAGKCMQNTAHKWKTRVKLSNFPS